MREELGKQSGVQIMKGLMNHGEDMNLILKATESHRDICDIDQIYVSKSSPWLWGRTGQGDCRQEQVEVAVSQA